MIMRDSDRNILLKPEYDLEIEEIEWGISVSQRNVTYVARKWKLTDNVKYIIDIAHKAGLTCHWQYGHPSSNVYLGNNGFEKGSHHLSFSRSHEEKWIFVIGAEAHPPNVDFITFNKAYRNFVANSGVTWRWEWSGGENILIQLEDLEALIGKLTRIDMDAIRDSKGHTSQWKSKLGKTGLNSEFLVEQALLDKFKDVRIKPKLSLLVRPHIDGLIPDIIITSTSKPLILELKLDIAGLPALEQISAYMKLSSVKSAYTDLIGGIIARDFHPDLLKTIKFTHGIGLFSYSWDGELSLLHVAGDNTLEEINLGAVIDQ